MGGHRAAITSRTAFYVSGLLAKQEGTKTERRRIMRDLHDDVAAKLLSLMHRVQDPAHELQARDALTSLRQVIYALDDNQPITLTELMCELQSTIRQRLRDTATELQWQEAESWPDVTLSAREHINLLRVVQEGVSNAVKHGGGKRITIRARLEGTVLSIAVTNDNATLQVEDWKSGKGLSNIRTRMEEIGGKVNWQVTHSGASSASECRLDLSLPLSNVNTV
jgi:signal transduction histidine kinase